MYYPPVDLVEMFLTLADKYDMAFYFGMYDSGKYWQEGLFQKEIDLNMALIDEVWKKYGHHKSFQGWYLSQEISRRTKNMSKIYAEVGKHAKSVSGNLTTLVSPYIHGVKTDQVMAGDKALSVKEHEEEWDEIFDNVKGAVDIMAFQDGQVDYHELYDYLVINKKLADKYNMKCWTNIESFDRDMPIRFLPIKWEKLLLKLDAARRAGMENAITFEFSHFMSPNSAYLQAGLKPVNLLPGALVHAIKIIIITTEHDRLPPLKTNPVRRGGDLSHRLEIPKRISGFQGNSAHPTI